VGNVLLGIGITPRAISALGRLFAAGEVCSKPVIGFPEPDFPEAGPPALKNISHGRFTAGIVFAGIDSAVVINEGMVPQSFAAVILLTARPRKFWMQGPTVSFKNHMHLGCYRANSRRCWVVNPKFLLPYIR